MIDINQLRTMDSDNIDTMLKSMTMAELKTIASALGLKVDNRKDSARATIINHFRFGEVRRMMGERKGRSILDI